MDAFEVRIGFCSIFLLILFLLIIFIFLQSDEDDALLVGKSINNNNPVAPSPTTTNRDVSKLVLNTYADRQSALSAFANAITLVVVVGINLNRDKWDVYFHNNSWPTTLRDGIYHVPLRLVDDERIPGGEHVYVNLAGNRLANSYDYRGFAAGVLRHGSARVENMLQQLARMLNSNEQFKMDHSFQLSWLTSNNTGAEVATSAKRNQVIPNHTPQKRLKWSIIAFKNEDSATVVVSKPSRPWRFLSRFPRMARKSRWNQSLAVTKNSKHSPKKSTNSSWSMSFAIIASRRSSLLTTSRTLRCLSQKNQRSKVAYTSAYNY